MSKNKKAKHKKIKNGKIEEEISKKNKNKKKKTKGNWGKIYICIFIGLLIIEEYVFRDLSILILKYVLPLISVSLVLTIIRFLFNFNNSYVGKKITRLRESGKDETADIKDVIKNCCFFFQRATFFHLILMLISLVYFPAQIASHNLTHKALAGIGKIAVNEFASYMNDDESDELENNDVSGTIDNNSEGMAGTDSINSIAGDVIDSEENYTSGFSNDMVIAEELIIDEVYEGDVLYLSEEDYEYLFFTGGEYKIDDWDNKFEVERQVLQKVEDLVSQANKNEFDDEEDGAPQDLRDQVAALSEKEADITILSEYLSITYEREEAYSLYPKYSLAKLISENYNLFGLAYYMQKYSLRTAEYYFGQAALWQYKAISFDEISVSTQRQLLLNISQRYEDIAYVCSEDDEEYRYSLALAEAFQDIANLYWNAESDD